jgi:DNA-binding beta-propeller fold protein YncE
MSMIRTSAYPLPISRLWLAGMFALMTGSLAGAADTNVIAWPPPPAEARVVFERTIASPADIGVKPSFLSRVTEKLTGEKSTAQHLAKPFGLSLDAEGNLVIADTGTGAVCYLDLAHKKWSSWTAVNGLAFSSPVSAVHVGRTFFVADSALGKIIAFDDKGRGLMEITNHLERPTGLALSGDRLIVADSQRHQVLIFNLLGEFVSAFGQRGAGPGEFNFPTHVSSDGAGRIYVTDSLNHRVQVFDAAGKFLRAFGRVGDGPGCFSRPKGVAVDTAGHVYVVDADFSNVQIFNEQGRLLLDFGEPGQASGKFWLPNGIAINSTNEIFIADTYNHRVQVLRYTGKE